MASKKPTVTTAVLLAAVGIGLASAHSGTLSSPGGSASGSTPQPQNPPGTQQAADSWRGNGLGFARQASLADDQCATHAYGGVRQFLVQTPCRSLRQVLLRNADGRGNSALVTVAWVGMRNSAAAAQLKRLVDANGSGNITPLGGQRARFTGRHFVSTLNGSTVTISEAAALSGRPSAAMLDSVAAVATGFPVSAR
jgi:hypothetical protein